MNTGVVSRRFAKALLDFACLEGNEDRVYNEVRTLARKYSDVPELRKAVDNPVLEKDKKRTLLITAAGGEGISEELKRFFELVLKGRRESFLPFMIWSFIDQYRLKKNIKVGKLTTAVPSEKLTEHLKQLIGKNSQANVELESRIDESILGGFIMEISGYRVDASVSDQLKRLKNGFLARNRRIV